MTARHLEGQVALVTGAGHGIGLAVAAKLGAAGASVVRPRHRTALARRPAVNLNVRYPYIPPTTSRRQDQRRGEGNGRVGVRVTS